MGRNSEITLLKNNKGRLFNSRPLNLLNDVWFILRLYPCVGILGLMK
jgi:hypothetical protein